MKAVVILAREESCIQQFEPRQIGRNVLRPYTEETEETNEAPQGLRPRRFSQASCSVLPQWAMMMG